MRGVYAGQGVGFAELEIGAGVLGIALFYPGAIGLFAFGAGGIKMNAVHATMDVTVAIGAQTVFLL